MFYDLDTLEQTPQGTVKVWLLAESLKGMQGYIATCKKCQEEAMRKWKAGYVPDVLLKLNMFAGLVQRDEEYKKGNEEYKEAMVLVVGTIKFEIAANMHTFYPANRAQFEFQCSAHKFRMLTMTSWDQKGAIVSDLKLLSSGWNDISPNTPQVGWLQLFCGH